MFLVSNRKKAYTIHHTDTTIFLNENSSSLIKNISFIIYIVFVCPVIRASTGKTKYRENSILQVIPFNLGPMTEHGDGQIKSPYSARIRQNTGQIIFRI